MMTLIEEKQTANAIAFKVEMKGTSPTNADKEAGFRKRMELEAAAFAPAITLETIQTKLEKAEERRASLHQTQPNFERK
jgi:hypothetical protein